MSKLGMASLVIAATALQYSLNAVAQEASDDSDARQKICKYYDIVLDGLYVQYDRNRNGSINWREFDRVYSRFEGDLIALSEKLIDLDVSDELRDWLLRYGARYFMKYGRIPNPKSTNSLLHFTQFVLDPGRHHFETKRDDLLRTVNTLFCSGT